MAVVGNSAVVLLLDFDLSKSVSSLATINPVLTVRQVMPPDINQGGMTVKQVPGKIVGFFGDLVLDGLGYDMMTDMGLLAIDDNSPLTQYVDAGQPTCPTDKLGSPFYCLTNKTLEADLTVTSSAFGFSMQTNPFWVARRVAVKSPDQPELEGVTVDIGSDSQFDIVLLHQVPVVAGLEMGDVVRISLQSGATIEAVDVVPLPSGLFFSTPSDLLVGQVVTARKLSASSGPPFAVTTDRVRLKSGALTARVKSVLNANDFVADNLPRDFSSGQIQVRTGAQTSFLGVSGVGALMVGDTVSPSGFLLKAVGGPVLLAESVRKR